MVTSTMRQLIAVWQERGFGLAGKHVGRFGESTLSGKMIMIMIPAVCLVILTSIPVMAKSQSFADTSTSDGVLPVVTPGGQEDLDYVRPTQRIKIHNYLYDTYGPYPLVTAALTAGIHQATNAPPEWNQGFDGYSKRYGSDFAIAAVGTTTRYGLAQAFKEDTMYYRCECSGLFPRFSHAVVSTLTGRHGTDGHRVFSVPALVAPYAGSMTAVYGWYPSRFNAMDGFRIGNYNLLASIGGNVALEFFYSGPHSLLARMHLNNAHGSPVEGPHK